MGRPDGLHRHGHRAGELLDGAPNQIVARGGAEPVAGGASYFVYPDWVELSYPALADAEGDRIAIEGINVTTSAQVQVTGFTTSAVLVYDVRDPRRPVQLTTAQVASASARYTITYWDVADGLARAQLLPDDRGRPAGAGGGRSSTRPAPGDRRNDYDYIAIVHRSLWDAIQPLLDHRAAQGLRVAKVDVQDIYDEFSDGLVDPRGDPRLPELRVSQLERRRRHSRRPSTSCWSATATTISRASAAPRCPT